MYVQLGTGCPIFIACVLHCDTRKTSKCRNKWRLHEKVSEPHDDLPALVSFPDLTRNGQSESEKEI